MRNIINQLETICPAKLWNVSASLFRSCRRLAVRVHMAFSCGRMTRYCPCCGLRFQSFYSGSFHDLSDKVNVRRYENARQDVLCPFCGSLPRHRILASWFEDHIQAMQEASILYFAPEKGMILWMKRNHISFVSADLYQDADLKLDIQETGLVDGSYDMVICNHVLEHVDDFRKALSEIYRILKSGGSLICSFPIDPQIEYVDEDCTVTSNEERILRFGQFDHKRIFGRKSECLLTEAGFHVEMIQGKNCPDEILPVIGPADYDSNILFHCVKG